MATARSVARRLVAGPWSFPGRPLSNRAPWTVQPIEESSFQSMADTVLDHINDVLDHNERVDIEHSDGVLTIVSADKHWVINKQTPNRQLWLSSPMSGPSRYDYISEHNQWMDSRSHIPLKQILEDEFTNALYSPIKFDEF
uniref:Ferroxidase n=1 Tax=Spongospora subterranea TaxID=70186 RepID=A0A0H5RCZ2_9EUKA|eukprot:CRZ11626.1 hypothetical protein [Spongospora subterranea]